MRIIYAFEPLPSSGTSAIFLAGPTPRAPIGAPATPSWRQDAIAYLQSINYEGDVLIPEPRDGWRPDYEGQVEWECTGRRQSDIIVFWVPRDLKDMPAFTTNVEYGEDIGTGKVIYGRPDSAPKNRYLDSRYQNDMRKAPHTSLESLLDETVKVIGEGALRTEGERSVPLWIWNTHSFQSWYKGVTDVGNVLQDFYTQKIFFMDGKIEKVFGWAGVVDIYITKEERFKNNEFVIARPDIAMVVPFLTDTPDNDILMVNEFRSAGNTASGYVVEPPAGSSPNSECPKEVALEELEEETGLYTIDPDRLFHVATKQSAATILSHKIHVYGLRLTQEESESVRQSAREKEIFGFNPNEDNGERIFLSIIPQKDLHSCDADWGVIGAVSMATEALNKEK
jgi:8-oxo-dGTP pyrophosphatase MutT (NUDIX family)